MQKYRSHKIVEAAKIENIGLGTAFSMLYLSSETRRMPNEWMEKHEPKIGGYFVCYPDGYESYSPAEAFEFGYTAVDEDPPGPKAIVINNNQSGDTFIGQTPPHATLEGVPVPSPKGVEVPSPKGVEVPSQIGRAHV